MNTIARSFVDTARVTCIRTLLQPIRSVEHPAKWRSGIG
jgi:hypothetical protein